MKHERKVIRRLGAILCLTALTGCVDGDDATGSDDYAIAEVALSATDPGLLIEFRLFTREISSSSWSMVSLTPTIVGIDATASAVLTMPQGRYVFRAEAYETGPFQVGLAREVVADLSNGTVTPVAIVLDLASEGDGGSPRVDVAVTAQNGADISQSSLTNSDPTPSVSTTLTIDQATDFEGDPIETGFVFRLVDTGNPEFFSGGSSAFTFSLLAGTPYGEVWAIAVDDQNAGTAHLYEFDPSVSPSLQQVSVQRVLDVQAMGGSASRNLIVLHNGTHGYVIYDFDGDLEVDLTSIGSPGFELLSWGPHPTNNDLYVVRSLDIANNQVVVITFNFNLMAVGQHIE